MTCEDLQICVFPLGNPSSGGGYKGAPSYRLSRSLVSVNVIWLWTRIPPSHTNGPSVDAELFCFCTKVCTEASFIRRPLVKGH